MSRARTLVVVALCWTPLTAVLWVGGARWPLLWREIPSQWNDEGVSNYATGWTLLLMPTIGSAMLALVATVSARGGTTRTTFFWCFGFGTMLAYIAAILSVSVLIEPAAPDRANWLVACPLLILAGSAAALLAPASSAQPSPPPVLSDEAPRSSDDANHQSDSRVTKPFNWTGRSFSILTLSVGVVLVTIAFGTGIRAYSANVAGGLIGFGVAALLLVSALLFAGVTVTIDESEVCIRGLLLPITLRRISLTDIDSVGATRVSASHWGVGFRVKPGEAGIIVRSGSALRVATNDGRVFVVAVEGADEAAQIVCSTMSALDRPLGE